MLAGVLFLVRGMWVTSILLSLFLCICQIFYYGHYHYNKKKKKERRTRRNPKACWRARDWDHWDVAGVGGGVSAQMVSGSFCSSQGCSQSPTRFGVKEEVGWGAETAVHQG